MVKNNRPTVGTTLHNIERATFLPPIKIISLYKQSKPQHHMITEMTKMPQYYTKPVIEYERIYRAG